ncbi:MAG: hypothetical protein P3A28_01705 [Gemmatimonadota bacterium]|nr:hypothetical protein [Gemmatimonadota bacterium]
MPKTKPRNKAALWRRINDYHFDDLVPEHLGDKVAELFGGPDASTKAFASKLSAKLRWPTGFALQAINEYKRFVFLGCVSDFYVTPPKTIDKVWHEHLLFSRGYRQFCRDVLQQEFDHSPELIATPDQTRTFEAQYDATIERYTHEFNDEPPAAIWGTPKFVPSASRKRDAKRRKDADGGYADAPLYSMVSDGDLGDGGTAASLGGFSGFGGGGGFSGGGSDGSFGDSTSDAGAGDSGGGDGGGSGCSSGCGGGGCGGGGD